jgi:anti-sigma-K factor RskA
MSADTDGLHALAAAYAVDALPAEERAFFERHLASCRRCAEEVAEHREAAAALAMADAQAPPAALRARVMDQIAVTAQEPNATSSGAPPGGAVSPLDRRRAFLQGAAAALLVAVLAVAGVMALLLPDDSGEVALDAAFLAQAQSVRLDAPEGTAATFYYSPEDDEGWLVVDGLDPLSSDEAYQLWLFHDEQPVPAGVFAAEGGRVAFRADAQVRGAEVVAVTVEPAGGLPEPSGPVVLSAPLEA